MNAASTIRVKISPEDAGAISMSRVSMREVPVRELVELIISVTGKDVERVRAILERGNFVKSLSRLRWDGFVPSFDLTALLDSLPGDDPARTFERAAIREIVVEQTAREFSLSAEVLRKKRLLRKQSFADALLNGDAFPEPAYQKYDYDAKSDRFRLEATPELERALRHAVPFLPGRALRDAIEAQPIRALVFVIRRAF